MADKGTTTNTTTTDPVVIEEVVDSQTTRPRKRVVAVRGIKAPKHYPLSAWNFISNATQTVHTQDLLQQIPKCWEESYCNLMRIKPKEAKVPQIPELQPISEEMETTVGLASDIEDANVMMEAEGVDSEDEPTQNTVTFAQAKVEGHKVRAIVDTGATQCVLAWRKAEEWGILSVIRPSKARFRLASGDIKRPDGFIPNLRVQVGGLALFVGAHVVKTKTYEFLLAVNWLKPAKAEIRFNTNTLTFQKKGGQVGSVTICCPLR